MVDRADRLQDRHLPEQLRRDRLNPRMKFLLPSLIHILKNIKFYDLTVITLVHMTFPVNRFMLLVSVFSLLNLGVSFSVIVYQANLMAFILHYSFTVIILLVFCRRNFTSFCVC